MHTLPLRGRVSCPQYTTTHSISPQRERSSLPVPTQSCTTDHPLPSPSLCFRFLRAPPRPAFASSALLLDLLSLPPRSSSPCFRSLRSSPLRPAFASSAPSSLCFHFLRAPPHPAFAPSALHLFPLLSLPPLFTSSPCFRSLRSSPLRLLLLPPRSSFLSHFHPLRPRFYRSSTIFPPITTVHLPKSTVHREVLAQRSFLWYMER